MRSRNLIFLISDAQRNYCNNLFETVKAQRNFAIAERAFSPQVQLPQLYIIKISQHNANYRIFCDFRQKK